MENQKPGSKALDQHGIALKFVVMLIASVMLTAVTCPLIFTYGMCKCPGWGRVERGGSNLFCGISWLQRNGVLCC